MAIDVDVRGSRGRHGTPRPSLIVDERNDHAALAVLLFDILPIWDVGELEAFRCEGILVLWLVKDYRSAVRDLRFGDYL